MIRHGGAVRPRNSSPAAAGQARGCPLALSYALRASAFTFTWLALGLAMLALAACGLIPGSRLGQAGSEAPPFSFDTWDGLPVSRADFTGQAVVLSFWASWCIPCRAEMPSLQSLYSRYREQGVAVVGVAVQDDPVVAREFLAGLGITYPTGPDLRNENLLRYNVVGLPTTVFIGRDGKVTRRWDGPMSDQQLAAAVREAAG